MTPPDGRLRVGFVLHVMQVAGAEMLVAETIRRLASRIDPVIFCLDGVGQLGEQMTATGVPVLDLQRRPGLDRSLPKRMAAGIERYELDVLHAHQYTPFFYTALARLFVRRPVHVMFTEHGRHFPDVVSGKRRLVNRFVLSRFADEINGVSQFSIDSLARIDGFGARPLEVIANGIDPERYAQGTRAEARARLGLAASRRHIACVARFHPIKDHAMLLRAFARVASAVPDVDLLLAGDGPLRAELTDQVAASGLSGRVQFLGVRSDVPDVLRAADIFALTSIAEAASITLLEAMASEVPVVVTDVGGNPEIVRDGVHGVMVPRGDDAAASRAFMALLADPGKADSMGREGRAHVLQHYRLETTVATYFARYRDAVARLKRRGGQPRAVHA